MTEPLHIVIGTPMYGGLCHGAFASSVNKLRHKLNGSGHKLSTVWPGNESLINRARDMISNIVLNDPRATHLLWIDADITFQADDILRMVAADRDVIMAPVPLKAINWSAVRDAALKGVPSFELHRHAAMFNVVHLDGHRAVSADEPFQIKAGGAGVMLIRRRVLDTLAPMVKAYRNNMPGDALPHGCEVREFFPTHVVDGELLSEDYGFCRLWRKAGGTIWAAPWCEIGHSGTYRFTGNYAEQYRLSAGEQDGPESADAA